MKHMRTLFIGLTLSVLCACGSHSKDGASSPNKWSDHRLVAVLEAQEHRATEELCAFLSDSSEVVREAAALAFASVQDSASAGCLLKALEDGSPSVRSSAAFALAFVADSVVVQQMAELAANERDTVVQRAYLSASFIAMQRSGLLKDPNAILYMIDHGTLSDRVRAADALRRLPDSTVVKLGAEIMEQMRNQEPEVRQILILAMKKLGAKADKALLQHIVMERTNGERVNAFRAWSALEGITDDQLMTNALSTPATDLLALDILRNRPTVDARKCLSWEPQFADTAVKIGLLGLAMKQGEEQTRDSARTKLEGLAAAVRSPYLIAEVIKAHAFAPGDEALDKWLSTMTSDRPAIERHAAFESAVQVVRSIMMRSRYASREAQYAQLGHVMRTALNTGDAGLISAAAEALTNEEPDVLRIILDEATQTKALSSLQPIRDLEARMLLEQVIAKRDGLPKPAPKHPTFNHPINKARLLALKQGQRYRITTSKGEIIIATDVNEAPGSSLAFDSLVTSGYYNGKSFHRVVPNFVAQGGCPRGDGYGGMPWTLRTEIGRTPFMAGSVGLASAGFDTESCQFFITHSATPHLDGRYTRFGEVVSGMDVVWMLRVGDVMARVEKLR